MIVRLLLYEARWNVVLILVFVEDGMIGFWDEFTNLLKNVLILVFVEDGMIGYTTNIIGISLSSLNPCFCGRWNDSIGRNN